MIEYLQIHYSLHKVYHNLNKNQFFDIDFILSL